MRVKIRNNKTEQVFDITLEELKEKWNNEWNRVFEKTEEEYACDFDWQYNFESNEDIAQLHKDVEDYLVGKGENLQYYWNKYTEYFTSENGNKPIWEIIQLIIEEKDKGGNKLNKEELEMYKENTIKFDNVRDAFYDFIYDCYNLEDIVQMISDSELEKIVLSSPSYVKKGDKYYFNGEFQELDEQEINEILKGVN